MWSTSDRCTLPGFFDLPEIIDLSIERRVHSGWRVAQLMVRGTAAHVKEDLQKREHLLEALLDYAHLVLSRPAKGRTGSVSTSEATHALTIGDMRIYPHTCERKVWKCLGIPCVIDGTVTSAPSTLLRNRRALAKRASLSKRFCSMRSCTTRMANEATRAKTAYAKSPTESDSVDKRKSRACSSVMTALTALSSVSVPSCRTHAGVERGRGRRERERAGGREVVTAALCGILLFRVLRSPA
jgi:hypothetical protein